MNKTQEKIKVTITPKKESLQKLKDALVIAKNEGNRQAIKSIESTINRLESLDDVFKKSSIKL